MDDEALYEVTYADGSKELLLADKDAGLQDFNKNLVNATIVSFREIPDSAY